MSAHYSFLGILKVDSEERLEILDSIIINFIIKFDTLRKSKKGKKQALNSLILNKSVGI